MVRFLEAVPSLKSRAALTITYAAGLRVSETLNFKVGDIDRDRMPLQVCQGKGAKHQTVMFSAQLLDILRTYWRLTRSTGWLFPDRGERPIDATSATPCSSGSSGERPRLSYRQRPTASRRAGTTGRSSASVGVVARARILPLQGPRRFTTRFDATSRPSWHDRLAAFAA